MATEILSVIMEDLKQQADDFGLEGKEKTKFLREEWQKIQDAKLAIEIARFEVKEKRLKRQKKNDWKRKPRKRVWRDEN